MLGRRGSSFGLQFFCVAIVMIMFVYGIYLYKNASYQLENVEKDNSELIIEKEGLSRDVQVLREAKSKLEQVLKDKQDACTRNEERIGSDLNKVRSDLAIEKKNHEEKTTSWNKERSEFQQQLRDLEDEKSKLRSDLEEMEGKNNMMKEENFDLKRVKQEGLNDAAKLNDEVANLKRKIEELNKFKELYEAQNPNYLNDTKKEGKAKQEVKQEDMQIAEPVEKAYFEPKTSKPKKHLKDGHLKNLNDTVVEQVVPPVVQNDDNNKEIRQNSDELPVKKDFKPDLPQDVIPKQSEVDVGDHQVEKPDLKAPLDKKEKIPKEQGDIDQDLNENQLDGEVNQQGEDDEDVPHRGLDEKRGAPQVMKVPQGEDTDLELEKQRRRGEP